MTTLRLKYAIATTLLLSSIAAGAAQAQATDESQQLEEMRQQIEKLQRQMQELQAQQQARATQSAQVLPSATVATAETRVTSDQPSFSAGPLTMTLGGFADFIGVYRNRFEAADAATNFNTGIPFPNSLQYHVSEFHLTARQSRFSLLTQGPQEGDGTAEAYLEIDFQSAAPTANSVESNSYNPRLRHYYATYRRQRAGFYMLAGQTYSLATLGRKSLAPRQEQLPSSIDGQYVVGFNWTRNPQLRFVQELGKTATLGLSLENPQASIFNGPNNPLVPTLTSVPGGFMLAPTTNYSTDVAPDVIAKIAWDPGFGHYELYGLSRAFRDRAAQENHTIYGGGLGIGMILPLSPQLDFQLSGLSGRGIGRYGSALLPDVTLRPDGQLATIDAYQALVGLVYRPTPAWTLYGYAGIEDADSRHFTATVGDTTLAYGYGSPLYDNSGCLIEGSTVCAANTSRVEQGTLGAWWKYYEGKLGNLQVGLQGSYTKRTAFDGVGGSPDTSLTTFLLSFRFYPYQN
ncbi:MAG: hypothetical protein ABW106_14380 [Steroidobacteraceae bacterium]